MSRKVLVTGGAGFIGSHLADEPLTRGDEVVVLAFVLALESPSAPGNVYNVGSGRSFTVSEVAELLAATLGRDDVEPEITGRYRADDIRHCFADIGRARGDLGYAPGVDPLDGIEELGDWLAGQTAVDRVEEASAHLTARGLAV